MGQWADVDFGALYLNADEAITTVASTAMENCYQNAAGGISRFPGLRSFATFPSKQTFITKWRGDLMAATDQGRLYRIDRTGAATDVTKVPISGAGRVIFDSTEDELVMAKGGPIIRYAGKETEILSEDAPHSTHCVFIAGYLVAIEPFSGRFYHSQVGQYRQWDPLDVFSAEGKPDNLVAAVVTPYRELLLAGPDSIEQFEPFSDGTRPFQLRWSTAEGVEAPGTFLALSEGTYGINGDAEFARFNLQAGTDESADIKLVLQSVDDWSDAWAGEVRIKGQDFVILSIPMATNPYGSKGLTLLLDQGRRQWQTLYDWSDAGVPTAYPVWSTARQWNNWYAGVPGGVAVFDVDSYQNLGRYQRVLMRTGHWDMGDRIRIDRVRVRFKRGVDSYQFVPAMRIGLRVNRDNKGFGKILWREFGRPGEGPMVVDWPSIGPCWTCQFEFIISDAAPVEIVGMKALVERVGH